MSESDIEDRVEDSPKETEGMVDEEETTTVESAIADDDDEEITPDELGIDLDSLTLNSQNILGRARPKPTLTTSQDKRPVGRPPKEDEGLFAWCESFEYTPGVDFLKLSRLFPKTWEGMSIGGFIEEVYEPIDEHWLADRWGGGSYLLESFQRDSTGRSRKTQVKHTEISGVPKAYMGSDGRPHLLPSQVTRSASSRRSEDVLRRRMGLGRFRSEDEEVDTETIPRSQSTANVDKPLTDASTVYKMIQETKKSENDALGVLREAQRDVHTQMQATSQQQAEMYKTLLDQQKDEMRRMREESSRAAENSSAPFKEMLKFMATQGSGTNTRENMDALRQAHDTAIQSLSREHASHIDNLRRTYEGRQTDLMDELNRVRTSYSQDIERIRSDYQEKERSSKDDAFRQFQTQLQLVQTQNSDLRERHRDELSTMTREKNEMIAALRQDLTELRQTLMTKEHESRMGLLERENTLRSEFLDRERQLQEKLNSLESQSRTSVVEERQRSREEFEDRYTTKLEAMKSSFDSRLESITQNADLRVSAAEKEAKAAVEIAKKEISAQYESQITRLETQLESLKTEYQSREQLNIERARMEQQSAQKERENQRLILESTAQSREALAEMTKKQLESKVRELSKDLERAKQDQDALIQSAQPESNDPFEQLERLNAIKERLKAHGFIDSKDSGEEDEKEQVEEKPKDLFGKILHYGPQFIGPILQRVDAATAVAQQAVSQQQQAQDVLKSREEMIQQQRMLEMEQQAAESREVALRERREMLLQRRMEREQALMLEQAQREAMVQQLQQQRDVSPQVEYADVVDIPESVTEVPQETQLTLNEPTQSMAVQEDSEMTDTSSNEGFKKLADYLNGALNDNKNASAIVGELKMALMMKMFSRETLNEILAEDFDTLVETVGNYHSRLKSPKARLVMKDVVKGLKS